MAELPVRISDVAAENYDEILDYTFEQFGLLQYQRYQQDLEMSLRLIGRHPEIGSVRPEYGIGIRVHPSGSHLIIYEIEVDYVTVHAIRHHSRGAPNQR